MLVPVAVLLVLGAATAVPLHDTANSRDSCGYENCPQYDKNVLNVHIVAHTHDDVGWLKTVDQYYYGSRNNIQKAGVQYILDSVIKELWADPKRKFIYVETAFFWKWWVRQPESIQNKVHTLVREGRLQFVGGAWSMNDEAAAHYHSTIDQFTWGLSKINETFGPCALPRVGWQIDPFGHAREFASLLAGMGYDGLFLGRIDYQDKRTRLTEKTMETLWRGDDDLGKPSDIFTGVLYNTYSPPPGFCFDVLCDDEPIIDDPTSPMFNVDDKVDTFIKIAKNMSNGYKTNNILVTMGEDFQYQDAAMWYQNLDKLILVAICWPIQANFCSKVAQFLDVCKNISEVYRSNNVLLTMGDDFQYQDASMWYKNLDKLIEVCRQIDVFIDYVKNQARSYRTNNVVVTMGGDFTYQDASMWYINLDKLIQYTNLKAAKDGLNIKLFYSTPNCYLKAVKEANPTLPTKQDDYFPYASDPHAYWTGYFTSRPTTKYFERRGNVYLQMAKQLNVLAALEKHNLYVINGLKSAMGVMQHHDAITGTEKQHVTHDYERILDQAVEDSLLVARQAFNKMIQGSATKPPLFSFDRCRLNESSCFTSEQSNTFVVTLYNPVAWKVNVPVRVPVLLGEYEVYAPNGDKIESQLVDIPKQIVDIPTRTSNATHELVFVAFLKPLFYKSFYVRKVTRAKRDVTIVKPDKRSQDIYENINDYWKEIRDKTDFDIKNLEDVAIDNDEKIPVEPVVLETADIKNIDFNVLKDDKLEQLDYKIKDLERIIKEEKCKGVKRSREYVNSYPNLNDEEMRMLSDDPMVVEKLEDYFVLENGNMKLHIDNTSGGIKSATFADGNSINLTIDFFYYEGQIGNNEIAENRSSGAYIFRPTINSPDKAKQLDKVDFKTISGDVVKEIRMTWSDNVYSVARLYDGLDYLEIEWVVGPINIEDGTGKEFIVRYGTGMVNNGEFHTDSNGRQVIKRKLGTRPQYNLTLAEEIAGNYYPVTNEIYIEDDDKRFVVMTDRSQGGSSLIEGDVELMLHRRLLHDDAFGVGEALNETLNGKGLIVTGNHRLLLTKKDDGFERKRVIENDLKPIVFVSNTDVKLKDWFDLSNCFSWLRNPLPEGIHLLTLEPWGDKLLLRLENYLTKSDDSTKEVDLTSVLQNIKVKGVKETVLSANEWVEARKKWTWEKDSNFSERFNKEYGNLVEVKKAEDNDVVSDDGFKVKIVAKQIRTFVIDYEYYP